VLDNAAIAELLMREAAGASGSREKAFSRAARAAFMWPGEASAVAAEDRSLTELESVGPSLARQILRWIESEPEVIPPPLRREFLTLAQARRILKKSSRWKARLKGDLQMHTVWSDGGGTISEMTATAIGRGYKYIAITDHTAGLKIANGLDVRKLREQGREIATLNKELLKRQIDFTILHSAEMNLSPSGEGDMPPAALAKLDLVLGCFHSELRSKDDQTRRYLSGLRNPNIQILGHPQTRMYNRREGLQADWRRVFAGAARLDKSVEIDGYADRQDLRVSLLRIARKEGVRISLGTDAHHPEQLAFMELGLAAASLAKIAPERIINFLPLADLKQWIAGVRENSD
jgi:histidinol phosphatase-like PHP family hydrolase